MQIHPIVRLFSAAILLAAAALIIPSPLIDSVQADPPPECEEWDPTFCVRWCCDTYETCVWGSEAVYDDCIQECEGEPSCEDDCDFAYELNLQACDDDVDFCLFQCPY